MSKEGRQQILCDVAEAVEDGSRQVKACELAEISERTLERWQKPLTSEDHRHGQMTAPLNKLTDEERAKILEVAVSAEFNNLSPRQIVPTLAARKTSSRHEKRAIYDAFQIRLNRRTDSENES